MNQKKHLAKLGLIVPTSDIPSRLQGPHSVKASSNLILPNPKHRVSHFGKIANGFDISFPRSMNTIGAPHTPDYSRTKVDSNTNLKTCDDESRPQGSFNYLDDDSDPPSVEKRNERPEKSKEPSMRKKVLMTDTRESFIIKSQSKKIVAVRSECYSANSLNSLNQLDKSQKAHEPICGIDDWHFRVLFRKKCQDLGTPAYFESEEIFITNTAKKSTGNKLCFFESGYGKNALEHLGQMLEKSAEVAQLVLRKSSFAEDNIMETFSKSLGLMPNLIHLDLSNNNIGPQDFGVLFKSLSPSKTLISLDISNYEPSKKNKLGSEGVEGLKLLLTDNIFIQFLNLSNLMLDDDNTQEILRNLETCPNLNVLNLSTNVITGKCLEAMLGVFVKTNLLKLDLSQNKLKREAAVSLAKCIQTPRGEDKEGLELDLENTSLGSEINLLLGALAKSSSIKKIDFKKNNMEDLESINFEFALSNNKTIQELDFSECRLCEQGGKLLAMGLKRNNSITALNLGSNRFGDKVAAAIIYSLLDNRSLKSLDLSQNRLGNESAAALQDLIKKNKGVSKYNVSLNDFDEQDGHILQEAIFSNPSIVQFNITYTRVKFSTIEAIESIAKENLARIKAGNIPKLRKEVEKRRNFVEEESYTFERINDLNKMKEEAKRDVKRFKETLDDLRSREKSPTSKKKEKLLMKLSKTVKEEKPLLDDINAQLREFKTHAELEKQGFVDLIEEEQIEINKLQKQIKSKQGEIERVIRKYEPDIKLLKYEIAKLMEENNFLEMYNATVTEKIKTEKEVTTIQTNIATPKISDVFLATSELAKNKKKNAENADKTTNQNNSQQPPQNLDAKAEKEIELLMKERQSRANKLIQEVKNQNEKAARKRIFRKQNSRSDNSKHEVIKAKIDAKLKNLFNEEKPMMNEIEENEANN